MKIIITAEIREEAALICALGASNPAMSECYGAIEVAIGGVSHEASDLAYADSSDQRPEVDAEAESLLRDGWIPEGEP